MGASKPMSTPDRAAAIPKLTRRGAAASRTDAPFDTTDPLYRFGGGLSLLELKRHG